MIFISTLTQQHFQPQPHHGDAKYTVDPVTDGNKAAANSGLAKKQRDQAEPEQLQQHDPNTVNHQCADGQVRGEHDGKQRQKIDWCFWV